MDEVCIIGGSRYFGKRLITRLRDAGVRVTVVNRGSVPAPEGVTHLLADRNDEEQLRRALGGRSFDAVIDQVLYRPEQAEIAQRVFAGRTARYVMTSTIEVYSAIHAERPLGEGAFDAAKELPAPVPDAYADGKRRAEAVLARGGVLPYVAVRTAHVLGGGAEDFTGRLDHYVERMRAGTEIAVHRDVRPSSFISYEEIADFLRWAAAGDFTGPVNACSHGELDVKEICELLAGQGLPQARYAEAGEPSPFSFGHYYGMDNSRAVELGYEFGQVSQWLPEVAAEALSGARGVAR